MSVMDIRRLKYFVTVADAGSISAAARELYVSQPALSVGIRKLERYFEVELFDRSCTPFALTRAGKYLYEHGKAALTGLEQLTDQVRQLGTAPALKVRVGLTVLFSIHYMPQIAKFMIANPKVEVTLTHSGSRAMQHQISAGQVDLGIVSYPCYEADLDIVPLTDAHSFYDVAVVMRDDDQLATMSSVRFEDLAGRYFSSLSDDYVLGEVLLERAQQAGFTPDIRFVNDSWDALLASVVELDSVCLLPRQIQNVSAMKGIAWVPLRDPVSRLHVGIATLKDQPHTPVIAELMATLLASSD